MARQNISYPQQRLSVGLKEASVPLPSPALTFASASSSRPTSPAWTRDDYPSPRSSRSVQSPVGSVDSTGMAERGEYVVALHDFRPLAAGTSGTCLTFNKGQIIRVISVDKSGWGDGEDESGRRGWFPSNYVRSMDNTNRDSGSVSNYSRDRSGSNEMARSRTSTGDDNVTPLQTIVNAIAVLQKAGKAGRTAHFQPSTACVISAVRSVLSMTDCLAKESSVLKHHTLLARQRKNILALLANLVSQARLCSAYDQEDADPEGQRRDIDALMATSNEVLTSIRQFLAAAQSSGVNFRRSQEAPLSPQLHKAKSMGDIRGKISRPFQSNFHEPMPSTPYIEPITPMSASDGENRSSSESTGPFEPALSSANTSVDSISMPMTPGCGDSAAGEHLMTLNSLHDRLLSALAAFIGHVHAHSDSSHPSSLAQLIDMASEVVALVRELLTLVDAAIHILSSGINNDSNIRQMTTSRAALYSTTTSLVEAVRKLSANSDDNESYEDDETPELLTPATSLLKEARSCVGIVRHNLHRKDAASEVFNLVSGPDDVEIVGQRSRTQSAGSQSLRERQVFSMLGQSESSLANMKENLAPEEQSIVERRGLPAPAPLNLRQRTQNALGPSSARNAQSAPQDRQVFNKQSVQAPVEDRAQRNYQPREICFNNDGQVMGGTLACLVERMTLHDTTIDPVFASTFFMTFRLFTTPVELLHTLFERFNVQPPTDLAGDENRVAYWTLKCAVPIRLRVFNIIKSWLETHWNAESDGVILADLRDFTSETIHRKMENAATRLLEQIDKRARSVAITKPRTLHRAVSSERLKPAKQFKIFGGNAEAANSLSAPTPAPAISRNLLTALRTVPFAQIPIIDFDPLEIARQLTIMESRLYCAIQANDLLQQEFGKTSNGRSSNIKNMSSSTTKITGWIAETILAEHDAKKRAYLVKYFIKVAEKCHALRNYNTLMAILAALGSSTITRLKRTWDGLSAKYRHSLELMRKATEHTRNYAEYRNALRHAPPPCLPFLGLYLTDVTFCYEGNPPTRPSPADPSLKLINFDRYQKMHKIVSDLQRFQVPYNLLEVAEIQLFLSQCLQSTDSSNGPNALDRLYRRSMMIEPRTGSSHRLSNSNLDAWNTRTLG